MKRYNTPYCLFFLFLLLSFLSCDGINQETPPYVITTPVCIIGSKPNMYSYAGVEFNFLNTSSRNITSFSISFIVYDAETERNPFIGKNIIKASFSGTIPAQTMKEYTLSLDQYLYVVPDEPYLLDFFYITEINYDDGSQWSDKWGTYYTRSY